MSLKKIKAKSASGAIQKKLDSARMSHTDGWINTLTGVGGAFTDKRNASYFQRNAISWDAAEDLWRSDDAAARVVEIMPDEMTREGFELHIENEEADDDAPQNYKGKPSAGKPATKFGAADPKGATPPRTDAFPVKPPAAAGAPPPKPPQPLSYDDDSRDIAELMMARCEDLNVLAKFHQALCFENAYGGAAILVGADDGESDWSKPLREDKIRSISFLNVLEPRELLPLSYYGDPRAEKYGEPAIYQLNRIMVAGESPDVMAYLQVHESRLIRFDGIRTGRRMLVANAGWGDSIFTRIGRVIRGFQSVWDGAELILTDFSQAVLKMKGLAEYVAKNGSAAVQARAQAISMSRSISNTVLIDSEEEFSRVMTPMGGFPEMMDRFCNRLAMACRVPVTILMGQAPAGLNATGASDLEWFANQVRATQVRKMKCQLERLLKLMFLDQSGITRGTEPENWAVRFKPLKTLSEMDKAQIHFTQAQADNLYINNDTLLPAEVAKSRFGGDEYSIETTVDLDLREETRAAVMQGEEITDPFHTGAGEPGATNAQDPEVRTPPVPDYVSEAGSNVKDPTKAPVGKAAATSVPKLDDSPARDPEGTYANTGKMMVAAAVGEEIRNYCMDKLKEMLESPSENERHKALAEISRREQAALS